MAIARALFSTGKTEWETPPELFTLLDREFAFTLDVCATRDNTKCPVFFTAAQNALERRWAGRCWMNPPYGRQICHWIAKAQSAASRGATVVCLVPARTDTVWWQDRVMRAKEVRLLRGRLTVVGAASPAPFPSAVVIFDRQAIGSPRPRTVSWDWRAALSAASPACSHHGRPPSTCFR